MILMHDLRAQVTGSAGIPALFFCPAGSDSSSVPANLRKAYSNVAIDLRFWRKHYFAADSFGRKLSKPTIMMEQKP